MPKKNQEGWKEFMVSKQMMRVEEWIDEYDLYNEAGVKQVWYPYIMRWFLASVSIFEREDATALQLFNEEDGYFFIIKKDEHLCGFEPKGYKDGDKQKHYLLALQETDGENDKKNSTFDPTKTYKICDLYHMENDGLVTDYESFTYSRYKYQKVHCVECDPFPEHEDDSN